MTALPSPETPMITVVGLGPAGAEFLTVETVDLLNSGAPVWLRTSRHPAATSLAVAGSFDSLYETLDSFEEVYSHIVAELLAFARTAHAAGGGGVIYAVPGSPAVAEHTVELLRLSPAVTSGEVSLDVRPAMAFTDLCWAALGIDPMSHAVTIIDALSLSVQGSGRVGPLLITQVHSNEVLEDVIGLLDDLSPGSATLLQGLGTENERVREIPWAELRTTVDPDHLTSLWIPRLEEPLGTSFVRLDELVRQLRNESDEVRALSFAALQTSLPTVTDSVVASLDALIRGDEDAAFDVEEHLADLLFLFVLYARLAAEAGYFTMGDLAETATERQKRPL